jgi:hypothetical protein
MFERYTFERRYATFEPIWLGDERPKALIFIGRWQRDISIFLPSGSTGRLFETSMAGETGGHQAPFCTRIVHRQSVVRSTLYTVFRGDGVDGTRPALERLVSPTYLSPNRSIIVQLSK